MNLLRISLTFLITAIAWCAFVLFGALDGWWLKPIAPSGDVAAFDQAIAARADRASKGSISLAILEAGEVRTMVHRGADQAVDEQTRFPVASLSKWITAYGVLLLAQEGRIDLDAPVSAYLERWHLPDAAPGFNNDDVTTRRLLAHMGGFTDALGFADHTKDDPPPALVDSLHAPISSSGERVELRVNAAPGTAWSYSGGGYLILELLVEDVTGLPFAAYMRRAVFEPIGMAKSTYAPLSTLTDTSGSWTTDGTAAPLYSYAALGATGLVSTVADLTRFAVALANGEPSRQRAYKPCGSHWQNSTVRRSGEPGRCSMLTTAMTTSCTDTTAPTTPRSTPASGLIPLLVTASWCCRPALPCSLRRSATNGFCGATGNPTSCRRDAPSGARCYHWSSGSSCSLQALSQWAVKTRRKNLASQNEHTG